MRTVSIQLYKFTELPTERAKERARDWFRRGDEFDGESVIADFLEVARLLGYENVEQRWTGFSSQGDGASFTGSWTAAKVDADRLRQWAPKDEELHKIALKLQDIKVEYPNAEANLVDGRSRYCNENSVDFEAGVGWDYKSGWGVTFGEFTTTSRELMRWLYQQLEKEYEYQQSAEYVDETIEINEYEFTEDGDFWDE